ncbi:MAG: GNAT family N-acetyltransferase [Clostridiaceae bacterium]
MENILVVRKAVPEDAEEILEITREVFKTYQEQAGISGSLAALNETVEDIVKDIETKHVFTALYKDKVIGSVRIEVLDDGTAYLSRFGVDSEYQSKGVGKVLIHAVDKLMEDLKIKNLCLHTASRMFSLVRFYYGQGFYIESTSSDRGYIRALLCKEYKAAKIDESIQENVV